MWNTNDVMNTMAPDQAGTIVERAVASAIDGACVSTAQMVEEGMISKAEEIVLQKDHAIDIAWVPREGWEAYTVDQVVKMSFNVQVKYQPRALQYGTVNVEMEQRLMDLYDGSYLHIPTCFGKESQPPLTVYVMDDGLTVMIPTKTVVELANSVEWIRFEGADQVYYPSKNSFTHTGKPWGAKISVDDLMRLGTLITLPETFH